MNPIILAAIIGSSSAPVSQQHPYDSAWSAYDSNHGSARLDAFGALFFGAIGWLALEFLGRPIRDFFDLRRRVRTEMLKFEHVSLPRDRDDNAIISQRPPITALENQDSLRD